MTAVGRKAQAVVLHSVITSSVNRSIQALLPLGNAPWSWQQLREHVAGRTSSSSGVVGLSPARLCLGSKPLPG